MTANILIGSSHGGTGLTTLGTEGQVLKTVGSAIAWADDNAGGGGANALGTYIVQTATNKPANALVLSSLATGVLINTTATGDLTVAAPTSGQVLGYSGGSIMYKPALYGATSLQANALIYVDGTGQPTALTPPSSTSNLQTWLLTWDHDLSKPTWQLAS